MEFIYGPITKMFYALCASVSPCLFGVVLYAIMVKIVQVRAAYAVGTRVILGLALSRQFYVYAVQAPQGMVVINAGTGAWLAHCAELAGTGARAGVYPLLSRP